MKVRQRRDEKRAERDGSRAEAGGGRTLRSCGGGYAARHATRGRHRVVARCNSHLSPAKLPPAKSKSPVEDAKCRKSLRGLPPSLTRCTPSELSVRDAMATRSVPLPLHFGHARGDPRSRCSSRRPRRQAAAKPAGPRGAVPVRFSMRRLRRRAPPPRARSIVRFSSFIRAKRAGPGKAQPNLGFIHPPPALPHTTRYAMYLRWASFTLAWLTMA